jgi:hypothetical protein
VRLDFLPFCIHERRLEQSAFAREATLLTERQGKDATSKALAESQGRIEDLVKDIHSANRKINQLQKTIERFVVFVARNHLHPLHFISIHKHPFKWVQKVANSANIPFHLIF